MKKILFVVLALGLSTGFAKSEINKEVKVKDFLKSRKIAQVDDEGQKCGNMGTIPAMECFNSKIQENLKKINLKLDNMILKLKKNEKIFNQEGKLEILNSYSKTVNAANEIHCAFENYDSEGGSLQRLGYVACIYEETLSQLAELDKMPLVERPN